MKESWYRDGTGKTGPLTQAAFAGTGAGEQDAGPVPAPSVLDYPMATPWTRWCARLFDLWWESIVVGFIGGYVLGEISPAFLLWTESGIGAKLFDLACLPLALLLDAAVHAVAGNTPGKAMLGLRVGLVDGRPLSFVQHLWRNLGVWVSGFGFGIPLVCFLTMGRQQGRLNRGQQASYDGEGFRLRAKPVGWGRRAVFGTVFVLMFGILTGAEWVDRFERTQLAARLEGPSFTWTNPATGRSASVVPHWEHTEQTSEDGLVLHRFTQHSEHAVLMITSEDSGGASLAQHAGGITSQLSQEWQMREGDLEDFRGHASWTSTGEKDEGELRIRVRLVHIGGRVWRVMAIQSVPMAYTDGLVDDLTDKLWDTVVQD